MYYKVDEFITSKILLVILSAPSLSGVADLGVGKVGGISQKKILWGGTSMWGGPKFWGGVEIFPIKLTKMQ